MDHPSGGKWFIRGSKHRKENRLLMLNPGTLLLMILSVSCESDINEIHGKLIFVFLRDDLHLKAIMFGNVVIDWLIS